MPIQKRQHYVFRHYLESWNIFNTSKLFCLFKNENRIVSTNTKNVAVKQYFYKFPELSGDDIKVLTIFSKAIKSRMNPSTDFNNLVVQILNFYKGRKQFIDTVNISKVFNDLIRQHIGFDSALDVLSSMNEKSAYEHINKGQEKRYCHAEHAGIKALDLLKLGDISFWGDADERSNFCYFLCNQYFRTKRMRDTLANGFKSHIDFMKQRGILDSQYEPNMNGISQVLCELLEACLVGTDLFLGKIPVLLENNTSLPFITCDQPIINISEYDESGIVKDFIAYYPISPKLALLLAYDKNRNPRVTKEEVIQYNSLIFNNAHEQVYSNDCAALDVKLYC